MKYVKPVAAAAAALSMSTAPMHAGGVAEPLMEPEVIAEEAAASSTGGFVLPLFLLILIAIATTGSEIPNE